MMTDDPLQGPKLKIERANSHIDDFVARNNAFFDGPDGRPYVVTREVYEKDAAQECFKLVITRDPTPEMSVIVGDAIHNLRSALDHLAVALAIQSSATNTRDVYFPVGRGADHFESPAVQEKVKKLSAEARAAIAALRPYKGGNDLLWALHEASLRDKHNALLAVSANRSRFAPMVGSVTMSGITEGMHYTSIPEWRTFDKEIVAFTFPKGAQLDGHLAMPIEIAFREIETIKGQPVIATLRQFSELTKQIVLGFEGRFFAPKG